MQLTVNLEEHSYPIFIEETILSQTKERILEVFKGKRIMIISDDQVYPIYGEQLLKQLEDRFEVGHYIVPHGEKSKSFDVLPDIYGALLENRISRSDLIIALGGGVVGDLTGFVAATFLRGIALVQIPTSLLAQVDSSVGGKVAVDLPQGKNLVGAFYHPKLVLIDPKVLDTLPERYVNDGMGEVIKYACIQDKELAAILGRYGEFEGLKKQLTDVIYRCVDCKRRVVEEDQFDLGNRMLLNFGHTLAHTIEQHFQYERESHGEAVAIGMYQISKLAEEKGLTKKGTAEEIKQLLDAYSLPHQCDVEAEVLLEAISLDKKNINNHLNVILLKEMGESYIYKTDDQFFKSPTIRIF